MANASLVVRVSAQIAEFQRSFDEASKTTKKFQDEFAATATKASAIGNLIARGAEMGARAFVDLGKAALENADHISDLASKTGLSMRTIQEFQHVAAETGTTVDAFANAAFKLGITLAGGGKSVVAGVTALGLSFEDLKTKSPDDQFRTVIKSLEAMDDQQERSRLGVLLFGKTYKEMAGAVAEGYTDLAKGARVMSDETVKRLANAQEAWERFGRATVIISGEAIAEGMEQWGRFQRFLANITFPGTFGPEIKLTPEQTAFDKSFADLARRQAAERTRTAEAAAEAEEAAAARSKKAMATIATAAKDLKPPLLEAAKAFDTLKEASNFGAQGFDQFENIHDWLPGFQAFVDDMDRLGKVSNFGEQGFNQFENFKSWEEQFQDVGKQSGTSFTETLQQDLARVPMILRNALVSGDWLGAAMDIGSQLGATLGKGIGTALGGQAGGAIGEAIGSLLGPLIGKIFGDTEYEKRVKAAAEEIKAIRLEAIETAGGLDRLRHQFSLVGIQIDEALKTRDPEWLRQVLDEGYAKTQLLNDAMQEYGFTWDNLGAEGRALQLGDLLTDLKAKTDVLIGAGIDELSVLMKQEAQYEDLLVKAIATNTEIPLAMRPLLERMQELGLLTDEATGQFIDLGQVTWAKSLTQGFDQVTKAIYDLRDALTKGVGGALDDLGKKSVRIPIGFDIENPPKGVPALASGGIVRRPTLALVGESGPEAVIPLSQMGGATTSQTITVNLDGTPLVRAVVKGMPAELALNGL